MRFPPESLAASFAWVIGRHCNPEAAEFVPALAMERGAFSALLARLPDFAPPAGWLAAQDAPCPTSGPQEELQDLLQLLLDHLSPGHDRAVAHLVAAASMGGNHLWQDLGLPNRNALSRLMETHFPTLSAKNSGDMKWKKFFYRALCEQEGIQVCKSPSCGICPDHALCFGEED